MHRAITFIIIAMFVLAFGCGNKTEEQPPVDETAAVATPTAAQPAAATADEELTAEEAAQLEKVYMVQAKKEINADNAEAITAALAKEIEADIASEQ